MSILDIAKIICMTLIVMSIVAIPVTLGQIRDNNLYQERCESFCNCSINDSCPYTFDYDDVKDCDCNIGGD